MATLGFRSPAGGLSLMSRSPVPHQCNGGWIAPTDYDWYSYLRETKRRPLPPTFALIDPFGWTGIPFRLLAEILRHPSGEVLVNFMYEEVNRFLGHEATV